MLLTAFILACTTAPEGLRATPNGDGPLVRVDWDAKPLADIPFPNDLATRPDPTSPTGLRLNVSTETPTLRERQNREKVNTLTGFGAYAPISVGFEGRLDLDEIIARHRDDPKLGADQFSDDALYVINVDPDSPEYLQPVELDIGDGRYPLDVVRTDRYFVNDTRDDEPSLLFDTVDEDLDDDGELDWGEDTDNDGDLDVPNVWPPDGDPRDDLLTWYELISDTLIVRPAVPMLEQTTYAVVLTERLVDVDGDPVRSPWDYVNHLSQTQALEPLHDALPAFGLTVDDVAYAWTFTTGRITGDLTDIALGLRGEGPYPQLADDYPPGVLEASVVHDLPGVDPHNLPVEELIGTLVELDFFDAEAGVTLIDNYTVFGDRIVGGTFDTPFLLADRDDGGLDWADEWWSLDPYTGEISVEPQRVTFTCVLPKEGDGVTAPFPTAIYGHGYGSSRFEFLGFAHVVNRMGMAACSFDFPGHGPTLSPDEEVLVEAILTPKGLYPFYEHLLEARFRDLDNDRIPDSGGDQWIADGFHARDMVRQAAVDWMAMVQGLRACGDSEWTRLGDGEAGVSCDWDDDGAPDIGADAPIYIFGGSLGGINIGVAAPFIPEVTAWASVVPGAGLNDVSVRTEIGGAVEAVAGRLMTPMFVGLPADDGGLDVYQLVTSVTDMATLYVGHLDDFPAGGRVILENLDNGEVHEGLIPDDGTFRLSIEADGLDPFDKAQLAGIPASGALAASYSVPDNEGLGDRLALHIETADGQHIATFDTWAEDVLHEGVTMPAGSPLIAGSFGYGHTRASTDVRRVANFFAAIVEAGDPAVYAPLYNIRPLEELGGEPINMLVMPTPGDPIVPVATGVALARSAGFIDRETVDPRYGMTIDEYLIDRRVVQGLEEHGPYISLNEGEEDVPVLFDVDDADEGTDGSGAPSDDEPLRLTVETSVGVSGLRLPYVKRTGTHGFALPDPTLAFDINTYCGFQIANYFATDGQQISDEYCMHDASCDWIPPMPEEGR